MMAKTSSQADFLIMSQIVTVLCVDLSKMANDFKFMASLLVPCLGYDAVSSIVKKSILENSTLRDIVVGEKYLTENEFNKIIKF